MTLYLMGLLGAGVGLGLLILVAGLRGEPVLPQPSGPDARARRSAVHDHQVRLWLAALLIGAVTWLLTGWVAAGLLVLCGAVAIPRAFGGQVARKAFIAKTEAIAIWTEMLRDTMAAADGVEEAIAVTVPIAPLPIRREVALLDARRRTEQPLVDALAQFGVEVDHPSADLVVAALSMAAAGGGSDFVSVFSRLAAITRDEVRMRQQVEANRAQLRTASRMIVIILGVTILGISVVSRGYLEPYGSATGQLWLVAAGGVFTLGIVMLERMSRFEVPERFSPRRTSRMVSG